MKDFTTCSTLLLLLCWLHSVDSSSSSSPSAAERPPPPPPRRALTLPQHVASSASSSQRQQPPPPPPPIEMDDTAFASHEIKDETRSNDSHLAMQPERDDNTNEKTSIDLAGIAQVVHETASQLLPSSSSSSNEVSEGNRPEDTEGTAQPLDSEKNAADTDNELLVAKGSKEYHGTEKEGKRLEGSQDAVMLAAGRNDTAGSTSDMIDSQTNCMLKIQDGDDDDNARATFVDAINNNVSLSAAEDVELHTDNKPDDPSSIRPVSASDDSSSTERLSIPGIATKTTLPSNIKFQTSKVVKGTPPQPFPRPPPSHDLSEGDQECSDNPQPSNIGRIMQAEDEAEASKDSDKGHRSIGLLETKDGILKSSSYDDTLTNPKLQSMGSDGPSAGIGEVANNLLSTTTRKASKETPDDSLSIRPVADADNSSVIESSSEEHLSILEESPRPSLIEFETKKTRKRPPPPPPPLPLGLLKVRADKASSSATKLPERITASQTEKVFERPAKDVGDVRYPSRASIKVGFQDETSAAVDRENHQGTRSEPSKLWAENVPASVVTDRGQEAANTGVAVTPSDKETTDGDSLSMHTQAGSFSLSGSDGHEVGQAEASSPDSRDDRKPGIVQPQDANYESPSWSAESVHLNRRNGQIPPPPPPPPPPRVIAQTRPDFVQPNDYQYGTKPPPQQTYSIERIRPQQQQTLGHQQHLYRYDSVQPQPKEQRRPDPQHYGQQRRGPPRHHGRPQYGSPHSTLPRPKPKPKPAWKNLWNRIEKGLDTLANVEDKVSGRAQKLYSSAVGSVKVPTVNVPAAKVLKKKSAEVATQTEQMDFSRFQKKIETVKVSDGAVPQKVEGSAQKPVPSYQNVAKFSMSAAAGQEETGRPSGPRKIDWNYVRSGQRPVSGKTSHLIRANGGASVPDDVLAQKASETANDAAAATGESDVQHPNAGIAVSPATPSQPQAPVYQSETSQHLVGRRYSATAAQSQGLSLPTSGQTPTQRVPPRPPPRRPFPDEEETNSIFSKIGGLVPRVRVRNPFRRHSSGAYSSAALDAWEADEEESLAEKRKGFFKIFRSRKDSYDVSVTTPKVQTEVVAAPISDLLARCSEQGSSTMLTWDEKDKCRSLGRRKAMFDFAILALFIIGARHFPGFDDLRVPHSLVEALTTTISDLLSIVSLSMGTLLPFAFVCAHIMTKMRTRLCDSKEVSLKAEIGSKVEEEAKYGSLFLRLLTSIPCETTLAQKVGTAASMSVSSEIDISRLRAFVAYTLAAFLLVAASPLLPLIFDGLGGLWTVLTSEQLRTWPPKGRIVAVEFQSVIAPIFETVRSLVADEFNRLLNNPAIFFYKATLLTALLVAAISPAFDRKWKFGSRQVDGDADEEEEEKEIYLHLTDHISNLGSSGASRLSLLLTDGRIESILERWRSMVPKSSDSRGDFGFQSSIRLFCYGVATAFLLALPLLAFHYLGVSQATSSQSLLPRWDKYLDTGLLLFITHSLVMKALSSTTTSADQRQFISEFVSSFTGTVEERKKQLVGSPTNIELQTSVSPSMGLSVQDLWASHVNKRAWAIRGANLICKNGEILILLGEDAAGKSRIISGLAESMVRPPRRSLTTQKVRGSISVGGLEVSKWDINQLKKRLGVFVNDVQSVSDTAQVLTGLSLEEILDPCNGLTHLDPSHSPGPSERASMMLALKITGLYSSLLKRLPNKMSTVVTASEDDLQPSSLRLRYQILSASEWSKLLLARVLAQVIYDNENSAGSNDTITNSLIGSVLLLDDLTLHMSEPDEAKILRDLRSSGAATVISSHRWATGRLADRIAVVKDGAIVETGTHNELLSRGAQQSIYASKWYAMTSA